MHKHHPDSCSAECILHLPFAISSVLFDVWFNDWWIPGTWSSDQAALTVIIEVSPGIRLWITIR